MSRYGDARIGKWPAVVLAALGLALAAGFGACTDDPTKPPESTEEAALEPGLNVYLTLDDDAAPIGSRVTVTGKVRAVGVELTPTGYLVDLEYDAEKLEPLESVELEDGVLRAVNLEAAAGVVKAAGAAPNGLESGVLFAIEMEVAGRGYADGLQLEVHELTVVEKSFMDVAAQAVHPPRALVVGK